MIAPMASLLIQPIASSLLINATKEKKSEFLPLLVLPLIMKVLEKGVKWLGKGYININSMIKFLFLLHPLGNIEIDRSNIAYLDSFGIEYIPLEVLNKIKNRKSTYLANNLIILLCVDFIVLFL